MPLQGCNLNSAWTSFANSTRDPSGVPSWAQLNFSDASWEVVDSPHDFIITGANVSESPFVESANQGQAFIPKTVGVYRKHFALPSTWAGTHVEVYLEGMYASANYYLNGGEVITMGLWDSAGFHVNQTQSFWDHTAWDTRAPSSASTT